MTEMRVNLVGPGARQAIKWGKIAQEAVESLAGYITSSELTSALGGYVTTARTVSVGGLATGGGALSGNITITVAAANDAETIAGTITNKAVTPAGLAAAIADRPDYDWVDAAIAVEVADRNAGFESVNTQLAGKALKATAITVAGLLSRTAGDGTLGQGMTLSVLAASAGETIAGTLANRAVTPAGLNAALGGYTTQGRPGDGLRNFTATLTGEPSDAAAAPGVTVTTDDAGAVRRVTGASVVASRERIALDPSRVYRVRFAAIRSTDPTDPSGSTVRFGVQFLNKNKAAVSQRVIADFASVAIADGRLIDSAIIGPEVRDGVDEVWPATARYMVPYIQTYDVDGVTDIQWIEWEDATFELLIPDILVEQVAPYTQQVVDALEQAVALSMVPALWGKTSAAPGNGTANGSQSASYYRTPMPSRGRVLGVRRTGGNVGGPVTVLIGSDDDTAIATDQFETLDFDAPLEVDELYLDEPLDFDAGDFLGWAFDDGAVRYTTGSTEESGGRWQITGSDFSSVSKSTVVTTSRFEIALIIEISDYEGAAARIDVIEQTANTAADEGGEALLKVNQVFATAPTSEAVYGKVSGIPSNGTADFGAATSWYAASAPVSGTAIGVKPRGGTTGGQVKVIRGHVSGNTYVKDAETDFVTIAPLALDVYMFEEPIEITAGDKLGFVTTGGTGVIRRTTAAEESGGRYQLANADADTVSTVAAPGLITTTRVELQIIYSYVNFDQDYYEPTAPVLLFGSDNDAIGYVFDGASEMEGNQGETPPPALIAEQLGVSVSNFGVGGQTIVQMQSDVASQVIPALQAIQATGRLAVLFVSSGGLYNYINGTGSITAATAVTKLLEYTAAVKAACPSALILVSDIWAIQGTNHYSPADGVALNSELLARAVQSGTIDALVRISTIPEAQDFTNPLWFNPDRVHTTTALNELFVAMKLRDLNRLLVRRMAASNDVSDAEGYVIAAQTAATTAGTAATVATAAATDLTTVLPKTSNYTAVSRQTIAADTTSAPWTLTLPAGGGIVTVIRRGANALTIAGNGRTIDGASTDNTLPENWAVTFRAASADAAWSYSYGA